MSLLLWFRAHGSSARPGRTITFTSYAGGRTFSTYRRAPATFTTYLGNLSFITVASD